MNTISSHFLTIDEVHDEIAAFEITLLTHVSFLWC